MLQCNKETPYQALIFRRQTSNNSFYFSDKMIKVVAKVSSPNCWSISERDTMIAALTVVSQNHIHKNHFLKL